MPQKRKNPYTTTFEEDEQERLRKNVELISNSRTKASRQLESDKSEIEEKRRKGLAMTGADMTSSKQKALGQLTAADRKRNIGITGLVGQYQRAMRGKK